MAVQGFKQPTLASHAEGSRLGPRAMANLKLRPLAGVDFHVKPRCSFESSSRHSSSQAHSSKRGRLGLSETLGVAQVSLSQEGEAHGRPSAMKKWCVMGGR